MNCIFRRMNCNQIQTNALIPEMRMFSMPKNGHKTSVKYAKRQETHWLKRSHKKMNSRTRHNDGRAFYDSEIPDLVNTNELKHKVV